MAFVNSQLQSLLKTRVQQYFRCIYDAEIKIFPLNPWFVLWRALFYMGPFIRVYICLYGIVFKRTQSSFTFALCIQVTCIQIISPHAGFIIMTSLLHVFCGSMDSNICLKIKTLPASRMKHRLYGTPTNKNYYVLHSELTCG